MTKNVESVSDDQIAQIFNDIDADGNQSIDRKEMFEFLKRMDSTETKATAPFMKKMSMKAVQLEEKPMGLRRKATSMTSIYKNAEQAIANAPNSMGAPLHFKDVPKMMPMPTEDADGNYYGGKRNDAGEPDGYGVKSFYNG